MGGNVVFSSGSLNVVSSSPLGGDKSQLPAWFVLCEGRLTPSVRSGGLRTARPPPRPCPAWPPRRAAPLRRSNSRAAGAETGSLFRLLGEVSRAERGRESRGGEGTRVRTVAQVGMRAGAGEARLEQTLVRSAPGPASGSWDRPTRRGSGLPAARERGGEGGAFPLRSAFVCSGLRAGVWRP